MADLRRDWTRVDEYLVTELVAEDATLLAAREAGRAAGLPAIEVAPNQGRLLALLCRMVGARRVLEFGTLAGYSTLWFADAVGPDGHVTTLEIDPRHAEVARQNFARAGVADRVRLVEGPAAGSAQALVDAGEEPFDLVFVDADKPSNSTYVEAALALSHPGTVIVVDNVVRAGGVADADSTDERVQGSRAVLHLLGTHPRLDATALQTVGAKGWDGFALALVRD
ncbi:O-methyltransferase [Cellulomonas triticagri]|uniref:O-methyltransferase n=1 Tax=Cellulomonas triticagri TaxID=2483352 RepID=A0A3M2JJV9_9CELL|nr:O-methyltransferase [Cellulomonas triticagri]RMI14092.1 O-methyltransferase [Cellulomonas triticagri]